MAVPKKITAYTELTSAAENDVVPVVDVSDTSMSANGTTKKLKVANFIRYSSNKVYANGSWYDTIQAAHDALPSSGGKIQVLKGTYNERPALTKNGVTVEGDGIGVTIIDSNDVDAPTLTATGATGIANYLQDLHLKDFTAQGNANAAHTSNHGIKLKWIKNTLYENIEVLDARMGWYIEDVVDGNFSNVNSIKSTLHAIRTSCVDADQSCRDLEFVNPLIDTTYNAGQGFYVYGGADVGGGTYYHPVRIDVIGGTIRDTIEAGIRCEGNQCKFTKTNVIRAGRAGIRFSGERKGGAYNKAIGCYVEEASYVVDANGLYIDDGNGTIRGSEFIGNTVIKTHSHGIAVQGTDTRISNNTIIDSGYGTGGTAYDAIFINAGGAAPVNVVRPKIDNNIAFDTRAGGSRTQGYGIDLSTSGSTTITDADVTDNKFYNNALGDYDPTLPTYCKTFQHGQVYNGLLDGMHKNAIINGDFSVWQRNYTFTNPSSTVYTADRWKVMYNVDGGTLPTSLVHSQQTPNAGSVDFANDMYRIASNGAGSSFGNNSYYKLQTHIEHGTRKMCGAEKKVTVVLNAKTTITGKKIGVYLIQNYGTGGTPSADEIISGTTFDVTTSFQEFSHTFTVNTLDSKTFGTNRDDYLGLAIVMQWGSTFATNVGAASAETWVGSGNLDLMVVSLNAGEAAQTFRPRLYADELALCQRYYEKSYSASNYAGSTSASNSYIYWVTAIANEESPTAIFKVAKRTTSPTVTVYSTATGTSGQVRDVTGGADVSATVNRKTDKGFGVSATLSADSEIRFNWTAENDY